MRAVYPMFKGFNPDPSIIRVGKDYYSVTSTFEWFPGVQIHHSTDLIHWKLIARPLNRKKQLNLRGIPDTCGIWTPYLSYDQGIFYLAYTLVKNFEGPFKDTSNYVVSSKDIRGEWSEPSYLNSNGIDGSLYHDDDGRKYYLSMMVDHRNSQLFGGIMMQEYHPKVGCLIGEAKMIIQETEQGKIAGSHLYKRNGYYYLLLADGGTDYGHGVSMARSKNIWGPYQSNQDNPIISIGHVPDHPFQYNAHGNLIETEDGKWYYVHREVRPLGSLQHYILGCETFITEMQWREDDWIYAKEIKGPPLSVEIPTDQIGRGDNLSFKDDFDNGHLNKHFQSLRIPITTDWASLEERPGFLRLYGRESLNSYFEQSLLACRLQHFIAEASTQMTFDPCHYQQMAGLICFYNTHQWHYLHISCDQQQDKVLQLLTCDQNQLTDYFNSGIRIGAHQSIGLMAKIDYAELQFFYRLDAGPWEVIGPVLDMSILSNDNVLGTEMIYYTAHSGTFVGICCQDLIGSKASADFDWFEYKSI
jgi:xylan 1,4-beta-xylosidase